MKGIATVHSPYIGDPILSSLPVNAYKQLTFTQRFIQRGILSHWIMMGIVWIACVFQLSAQSWTIGPPDPSIGTSAAFTATIQFVIFDVLHPAGVLIDSVDLYPTSGPGQLFTIVIQNSAQSVIATYNGVTTVASGQPQREKLNLIIPPGTGYRWGFSVNPGMTRNSTGAVYPYTVPGVMSITGNTFSAANYYFFYNIRIRLPYPPIPHDAGVSAITSPVSPATTGLNNVKVTLNNYGTNALTSASINWSVNGMTQTSYAWTGNLPSESADTGVLLGSYSFSTGNHLVRAWTSLPNGIPDSALYNDTATLTVLVCNQLTGTYTVGASGADFPTIQSAATAAQICGVSGPVTFNILPGTYTEQVDIPYIPGSSAMNTIIFTSSTGVASDVILTYTPASAADNWVLRLNAARYTTIQDMTIKTGITGTFGRVIELIYGASNNVIMGNVIESIPATTSTNTACIYSGSTLEENNVIAANTLRHGYYSIYMSGGGTTVVEEGNIIDGNIIENFHYYGMWLQTQKNMLINNNVISNGPNSGIVYAIRTSIFTDGTMVTNNRINMTGSGANYGIYLNNVVGTVTNPALYANNMICQTAPASGALYMTYFLNSSKVLFCHNSLSSVSPATNYGLYFFTANSEIQLLNNLVVAAGGGQTIYGTSANLQGISISDYNNFFTTGPSIGYAGFDVQDITAWRNATGLDSNSVSINPLFLSNTALYPTSFAANNLGTPIVMVPYDIDGNLRSTLTPDIGAVEFEPPQNDAGISAINSPVSPSLPGIQTISATLKNYGMADLLLVNIHWRVNNGAVATQLWNGILSSYQEAGPVVLGIFNFPYGDHVLKIWTTGPNGSLDGNPNNDTAIIHVRVCDLLSGTYTIGGIGADYPSISAALTAMDSCGVYVPVIFNIFPGTYNEQLSIGKIPGASSSSTVTFRSSTGLAGDVILTYTPIAAGDNWVIRLDGTQYLTLQDMTIKTGTSGSYGRVIELMNGASYNNISHNIIESIPGSTSTTTACIFSPLSNESYNVISHNILRNGYYGIYLSGPSALVPEEGNMIIGNTITDYYSHGIYIQNQEDIVISENTIVNAANSANIYALRLVACSGITAIDKNQMILTGSNTNYGIHMSTINGSSSNPILISNNIVNQTTTTSANLYMAYIGSSRHVNFFNNTFSGQTTLTNNGINFLAGNDSLGFVNNIVCNLGGGYAVSGTLANLQALTFCNYNNLFTTGPSLAFTGSPVVNLLAWQQATGLDGNSVSIDPVFYSVSDVRPTSLAMNNKGIPLVPVPDDIYGAPRDSLSPDLGAIEYEPILFEAALLSIDTPIDGCDLGLEAISIRIVNRGAMPINGGLVAGFHIVGSSATSVDTITNLILSGDTLSYTFSTPVNLTTLQDSVFHLLSWISLAGDSNQENDTSFRLVRALVSPPPPLTANVNVLYGQSALLSVNLPDSNQSYYWYLNFNDIHQTATGVTFQTPPIYDTSVYFVDAMYGDGFSKVNTGPGLSASPQMPTYGYFDYSWSYCVYDSAEIGLSGNVRYLSYYVDNPVSFLQLDQRIYMAHTTDTVLSNTYPGPSGMSLVYQGNINWVGPGWFTIPLASPFFYNGHNRLVIYWENHDGDYASFYPTFRYTTTTDYKAVYQYADNNFPSGNGVLTYDRPDILLQGNSNGCHSLRIPDTVFVIQQLVMVNLGSDTAICLGDTLQLHAAVNGGVAPYTYAWSPAISLNNASIPNPLAFPQVSTTYSVTVSDQNADSGTDDIIVTVKPKPNIVFPALPSVDDNTPPFPLTGGTPAGGTYSGPGVTGGIFNPAVAGVGSHTITYTYTDPVSGCTASATSILQVTPGVGIGEVAAGQGFAIWPNPSTGMVMLTIKAQDASMHLEVLDLQGKVVMNRRLINASGHHELDLMMLPQGVYQIRLTSDTETLLQKLILH